MHWPLAATLSDDELQARLYPPPCPRSTARSEPDYAGLHQELKRPGVTLELLWQEYRAAAGERAYRYSAFCDKYRAWAKLLKRSMRQVHPAGERLFVDYAGQTMAVVGATTGGIRRAQIFVAVRGASNYTYACATWQQTAADWRAEIPQEDGRYTRRHSCHAAHLRQDDDPLANLLTRRDLLKTRRRLRPD